MRTHQTFAGINNVLAAEGLKSSELRIGSNVDIDIAGRVHRRSGFTQASAVKHANVWDGPSFTLATRGTTGDLVNVDSGTVLAAAIGHARMWYCALPDGRVAYSNGTATGIVNAAGTATTGWGVPVPAAVGAAVNAVGSLHPGDYQWSLTHQRLADGAEGGAAYSNAVVAVTTGGVSFSSLPVLAGYRTNVYLTSHYGGERFLAGSTTNDAFSFTGENKDLQIRCPTEFLQPAPAGKLVAFWRGRALVAVGKALFASRPYSWELFDLQRDFKHFPANITLVNPVDGGIWVGTEDELMFLAGTTWDKLVRTVKATGPVVLGSGAAVPGEHLKNPRGDRTDGECMVCIADGWLVSGSDSGVLTPLSVDRYRVSATEVVSTFRLVNSIPQYIAIPR